MPFPFRYFLGGIPLQKGCPVIMLIYLIGNLTTVFTCVSAYTIGDALFASKPRKTLTFEHFLSRTWNYYVLFVFVTSCLREFLWVSIAAVGITLLAFFGALLEIPGLMIPFLIYEISVNLFFSYVKILWCAVFGLAMHAPAEFVITQSAWPLFRLQWCEFIFGLFYSVTASEFTKGPYKWNILRYWYSNWKLEY